MFRWQASSSAQVRDLRVPRQTGRNQASACSCPAEAGRKSARCHRWKQGFGSGTIGQDRVSARELRNGRPRTQVHGLSRQSPGFGQGNLPFTAKASAEARDGGDRNLGFGSAVRRTARASALTGSQRGNPKERKLPKDSGERPEPPAQVRPRNSPKRTASPPRLGDPRRGTVGAGGNVSPHFLFGAHFLWGAPPYRPSHPLDQSCQPQPAGMVPSRPRLLS